MYSQNPRVRDAQNPYRTGVLIGNYTEDRFGRMLAEQPVRNCLLLKLCSLEIRKNWNLRKPSEIHP
jgi:hypothetical protein